MRLMVNKFMLRHNGRLYRAGESLELPDTLARSLAEKSAGAYSLVDTAKDAEKEAAGDAMTQADIAEVLEKATAKGTAKAKTAAKKTGRAKK